MEGIKIACKMEKLGTSANHCSCCLKGRKTKRLFVFRLKNYGCTFKLALCKTCLNDMFNLSEEAEQNPGEILKIIDKM